MKLDPFWINTVKKILRSSLSAASEIFLKLQKYKISNKIGYIL